MMSVGNDEMAGRPEGRPGLERLGWSAEWEEAFAPFAAKGYRPGRVAVAYGMALRVRTEAGEVWAVVPGRMRHRARSSEDKPAVGDWVALRMEKSEFQLREEAEDEGGGDGSSAAGPFRRFEAEAVVQKILPRRSRLVRKAAGEAYIQQVLAANVDYAWLVSDLGPDYNSRRLERYLALAREGNTEPVIVLNKADLVEPDEAEEWAAEASELTGGEVPVHVVSTYTGRGMDELRSYLKPGTTMVLLGSSGVGKSSLINSLAGNERLDIQEVSDHGKGRHTTTRRELVMLPGGGLLIDTPGIRELQVWEGERGVEETFPDIEELAAECRFTNCGHTNEPGCAVNAAVEEGRLDEDRLDAWHKLREEARHQEAQRDARAKAEEKRQARMGSKAMKPFKKRH